MEPILTKSNNLFCLDSGVWAEAEEADRSCIDYTDGDAKEADVRRVIENARDLSCDSLELDRSWQEWALEYHLTSLRSNLLRGFDFSGVRKVLEVGCGCGAITRYLGEQGLQVDAIEGSMQRAEIARLRCRDLDNVNIVCSDYNHLQIPVGEFDLILFIGVLEYSGVYAPEGTSPEEQLVTTLSAALEALAPRGVVVIAIENRIGFKYLSGAREDHLGMPHVGVRGYLENPATDESCTRGVRTYDKQQWQALLERVGVGCSQFSYPFPDYKLPVLLMGERFIADNRYAFSPLHGTGSRDYLGQWHADIDETLFWKTAAAGNFLDQVASSFLIVAGRDSEPVKSFLPFDFVRFSSRRRKLEYQLQIGKPAGQPVVVSRKRNERTPAEKDSMVFQHVVEMPYMEGELLSERWIATLKTYGERGVWESLLKEYHSYLENLFATNENPRKLLDALPSNIVVEATTGKWQLIDLEWEAREEITADFVFFRAILQFALWDRGVLRFMRSVEGVQLVGDLVASCFELVGRNLGLQIDRFVALENAFQNQVIRQEYVLPVRDLLRHRLYEIDASQEPEGAGERLLIPFEPYIVTIYWAQSRGLYVEENSLLIAPEIAAEGAVAELELPVEAGGHRFLRIDPANHLLAACNSMFRFCGLSLEVVEADGRHRTVLQLDTLDELLGRATLVDLERIQDARGELLLVESFDPQILFDLGEGWAADAQSIRVRFTIEWPYGDDYMRMRKLLASEDELLVRRVWEKRRALNSLEQELAKLGDKARQLEEREATLKSSRSRLSRLFRK